MAENNKSYRIRTTVGQNVDTFLNVQLDQDYDSFEILSLKLSDKDVYKLHNSDYGVIVGRVLANGNFGVPNAKISVFIEADERNSSLEMWNLYPYTTTSTRNDDDIRYNLLPDESVKDCHRAVGTFPNKTYLLDNDAVLEVFDKYYIYTTRTNAAGDYLICGVPTGNQMLHMDLDLSDCGILSQRPRDFVYKGYTIEQFENPNQFKKDENLDGLSQIFSQNQPVYVKPFWGNKDNGDEIGITRADIEISFKFEPTCVFMGSAISDNPSNGVGKKCVPTNQMGLMEELTAGEGTIEMIRKTPGGNVEEFSIKGTQLIDGNGVWCYQIPMNLDYMMTDEYGNMVPTDDPEKGIPTRTRVRFRASLTDMENGSKSYYRAKYLIPNNPGIDESEPDYNFGTYTKEDSYRDLFWNGVYTVKSYIPRFQKSKRWKSERFTGIKQCNYYGNNNPMPYNNLRIKLPFMFTVLCIFVKLFIKLVTLINRLQAGMLKGLSYLSIATLGIVKVADRTVEKMGLHCTFIGDGLCPDMEGWYFAPGCAAGLTASKDYVKRLKENTLNAAIGKGDAHGEEGADSDPVSSKDYTDETSIDSQNTSQSEEETACVTFDVDYLLNCFEMNLAQEYRVIKFDFYNDWVNGVLYFPRWMRKVKKKKKYNFRFSWQEGISVKTYYVDKVFGCMNSERSSSKKSRYYTQQCSLSYTGSPNNPYSIITSKKSCNGAYKSVNTNRGSMSSDDDNLDGLVVTPSKCHKKAGMDQTTIFGEKAGLVTEETTMLGQYVYYLKPCEWKEGNTIGRRTLLFATDIVLLGTLNDCDENGIPQAFKFLSNSSYIMPTNLALTTMDDDAYIFSDSNGSVCSSSSSSSKNKTRQEDTARRIIPDYESTNKAYKKTDGDQIDYIENDDSLAVTESAGITWNYSGPGQDPAISGKLEKPIDYLKRMFGDKSNNRYNFLYYPGGHFLGLSCVNSDTNIKSCVNLKRICEVGASMSQRREVMRSYKDGIPKYRYYVPTGLISNVDIEAASFRSMFATMNHNKLIATKTNETTGYKKYDFRFLRPDGFDGGLMNFIHKKGSPYNVSINADEVPQGSSEKIIKDETSIFEILFGGKWFRPKDYDPEEAEYTERRTVEDIINDYYMFRFGIPDFSDKEQKKHYLIKDQEGFKMPQYENSFYFYFGLKDGSTALDEFKKQFFSECASNIVMKTPDFTVVEKVYEKASGEVIELVSSANIMIDNMLASYVITITDNTKGETDSKMVDLDNVSFTLFKGLNDGHGPIIGHEYTITVTDSLNQTVTKTIVFGSSAVKVDAETVNFRFGQNVSKIKADNPREGGYIKLNKKVTILKKDVSDSVSFRFLYVPEGSLPDETLAVPKTKDFSYTDEFGEEWNLYYMDSGVGRYNVYVYYLSNAISVYDTSLTDNKDVNVFLSCDYLGYKPEPGANNYGTRPSANLSTFAEGDWYNSESKFNPHDNAWLPWKAWLMRHTFYRQTQDNRLAMDNYIYTKGKNEIAIFGQPERGGIENGAVRKSGTANISYYSEDFSQYAYAEEGGQDVVYTIDDRNSFIPMMYWDISHHIGTTDDTIFRNAFDAMAYTQDGRAAASAMNITITGYSYNSGTTEIKLSANTFNGLTDGHGAIVVFENGRIVFPVRHGNVLIAYGENPYLNYESIEQNVFTKLLSMATVYPTLRVPQIYKPFYGEVSALTWNTNALRLVIKDEFTNETAPSMEFLPLSYKVEGTIFNGLTYDDKFYGLNDDGETYQTYLIDNTKKDFWSALTKTYLTQREDRLPFRQLKFGSDSGNAWCREVVYFRDAPDDVEAIEYAVAENYPDSSDIGAPSVEVKSARYEDWFDQAVLADSASMIDNFFNKLKIKVYYSNDGLNGTCSIYTDEPLPPETDLFYLRNAELFERAKTSRTFLAGEPIPLTASWYNELDNNNSGVCYGYYNENSEFDIKGAVLQVSRDGNKFTFERTNRNGQKEIVTVRPDALATNPLTNAVNKLYRSGVTLYFKYIMKDSYMTSIPYGLFSDNNMVPVEIETPTHNSTGCQIDNFSSEVKTLVARYVKPADGTMNKMVVYKVYAPGSLNVMFPVNEFAQYLFAQDDVELTSLAQQYTIQVSTNVEFTATTTSSFINNLHIEGNSVVFNVTENTGSSDRTGQITIRATDDELEETLKVTVTVKQYKSGTTQSGSGGDNGVGD